VNSLAHILGSQRYDTGDDSRNNGFIALLTMGEGWHNNHHHFPVSARQGFFWWEIDMSYYLLKLMSYLGIIWELRHVPSERLYSKLIEKDAK
jgi:stearoyl-CoA desaturase (delta-9 desaturase)